MTLRKIFETAIEISDPSERSLFINRACHGQPELLQNVLSLIKNYETDDSFMEKPPASPKTLLQYGSSSANQQKYKPCLNRLSISTKRNGQAGQKLFQRLPLLRLILQQHANCRKYGQNISNCLFNTQIQLAWSLS